MAKNKTEAKSPKIENVRKSISLPPRIDKAARERAKAENRSISNYIQSLIIRDSQPKATA